MASYADIVMMDANPGLSQESINRYQELYVDKQHHDNLNDYLESV